MLNSNLSKREFSTLVIDKTACTDIFFYFVKNIISVIFVLFNFVATNTYDVHIILLYLASSAFGVESSRRRRCVGRIRKGNEKKMPGNRLGGSCADKPTFEKNCRRRRHAGREGNNACKLELYNYCNDGNISMYRVVVVRDDSRLKILYFCSRVFGFDLNNV